MFSSEKKDCATICHYVLPAACRSNDARTQTKRKIIANAPTPNQRYPIRGKRTSIFFAVRISLSPLLPSPWLSSRPIASPNSRRRLRHKRRECCADGFEQRHQIIERITARRFVFYLPNFLFVDISVAERNRCPDRRERIIKFKLVHFRQNRAVHVFDNASKFVVNSFLRKF